jgi:hypothetical protein
VPTLFGFGLTRFLFDCSKGGSKKIRLNGRSYIAGEWEKAGPAQDLKIDRNTYAQIMFLPSSPNCTKPDVACRRFS